MLKKFAPFLIVIFLLIAFGGCGVSQYNKEVTVRTTFENEYRVRTAQYDKMWKILKQKGIVAKTNDSSFHKVVNAIMTGRKDGENLGMKWIQEQNPGAQFTEVAAMYKDLSRTIEAERNSFFEQERVLSDIKAQHDMLLRKFPGSILFGIFGTQPIKYNPIQSSRTEDVIKTGKDDNVDVF